MSFYLSLNFFFLFLCLFFLDCSLTLAPFAPTWAWRSLCSGQPEAPLTSTALFCLRRSAFFSFSYYFFFFSLLSDKEFPSEFFWRVANIQGKSKNFVLAQIKKRGISSSLEITTLSSFLLKIHLQAVLSLTLHHIRDFSVHYK